MFPVPSYCDRAAVNMAEQVSGVGFFRHVPGSGAAGSCGRFTLAFGEFSTLISIVAAPICNSVNSD